MINKIKDFLKNKLSRQREQNLSDQEEILEEEIIDEEIIDDGISEDLNAPAPSWKDKLAFRKNKPQEETPATEMAAPSEEDKTGITPLPVETVEATNEATEDKTGEISVAREDKTGEIAIAREDKTGEISLPAEEDVGEAPKKSWKEKFKIRKREVQPVDEDLTGETLLPIAGKESWKDKLTDRFSGFRTKLGNRKTKEWKTPEAFNSKSGEGPSLLSPSLSKSIETFLSREARETIHQISLVVVICSVTYALGKVTALFLKGPPAIDSARDYAVSIKLDEDFNPGTLAQVRSINIFRTNTGLGQKKKVADTKCEEAQQPSNLPIKLVNTIVLQDTIKSLASVQVRGDRDLQEVREGDQISNLAKIFKITRLEILVKNLESGVCESIASDKARETRSPISVMSPSQSRQYKASKKLPGIENVGNKFQISKTLLDEKMKDIAAILTQARAIKIQNPDGTLAFKLTEMDPQGIFPYLGLQDQDIITSINGKPIYDMNEVMSLFARIKNLDNLQLGVKREGTDSVQEYSIKK